MPRCGPFDWLGKGQPGEKDRPGQTVARFSRPGPHRTFPSCRQKTIYLLPLGDVTRAPPVELLCELLRRWFMLDAAPMKSPPKREIDKLERCADGCGYGPQIETPSARALVHAHKPKDAFAAVAYTMEDICDTAKDFGFLFGQADLDKGVGIFSFARYADGSPSAARFLRRCGMVLCHEVGHLFGIAHCVYAPCVMNGSNHLGESERRPFALCPVDLRKLALTLAGAGLGGPPLDAAEREAALADFFAAHGLDADAAFSRRLVESLEN